MSPPLSNHHPRVQTGCHLGGMGYGHRDGSELRAHQDKRRSSGYTQQRSRKARPPVRTHSSGLGTDGCLVWGLCNGFMLRPVATGDGGLRPLPPVSATQIHEWVSTRSVDDSDRSPGGFPGATSRAHGKLTAHESPPPESSPSEPWLQPPSRAKVSVPIPRAGWMGVHRSHTSLPSPSDAPWEDTRETATGRGVPPAAASSRSLRSSSARYFGCAGGWIFLLPPFYIIRVRVQIIPLGMAFFLGC